MEAVHIGQQPPLIRRYPRALGTFSRDGFYPGGGEGNNSGII